MNSLIPIWGRLIIWKRKTIDDAPENIRQEILEWIKNNR